MSQVACTRQGRKVQSLEDMQNFVDNYSEFSTAQRNASKHITLMSELSKLVDARTLMQVRRSALFLDDIYADICMLKGMVSRCQAPSRRCRAAAAMCRHTMRWSPSLSAARMSPTKTGYFLQCIYIDEIF